MTGKVKPAIDAVRLADEAYRMIVKLITTGELGPRDRVVERELCERLEMSRTPVRQALHRLAAEGLVVSKPNCGVRVRELTTDDLIELFLVREAMETQAARYAALRASDETIQKLFKLCDEMDAVPDRTEGDATREIHRLRELDVRFHYALVEASGIRALLQCYRREKLIELQMFGWHISRLPQYGWLFYGEPRGHLQGEAHRKMVRAIATHDCARADAVVREEVQQAILKVKEGMAQLKAQEESVARTINSVVGLPQ